MDKKEHMLRATMALEFIARTTLQGKEATALVAVQEWLTAIQNGQFEVGIAKPPVEPKKEGDEHEQAAPA